MKAVKIVGAVIGVIVVLVIAAAVVIPLVVNPNDFKDEIAQKVREATGRDFAINGDIELSLFPSVVLAVHDVRLANAAGASRPTMVAVKSLRLEVALGPLLGGEIAVDRFILDKPVINLEVDKAGRGNWVFAAPEAKKPDQEPKEREAAEKKAGGLPADISLGDVRLIDGRITYRDAASGEVIEISDINVSVALPDLSGPFAVKGALVFNNDKVTLEASGDALGSLLEGKPSPLKLTLRAKAITLTLDGKASAAPMVDGVLDLSIPSLRALAAWAGQPLAAPGKGFGPLSIKGRVGVNGRRYAFSDATFAIDGMTASGAFSADLTGRVPAITAKLDTGIIDVNLYLPPAAESGSASRPDTTASAPPATAAPKGWSKEPLNFAALRAVDADIALSAKGIKVRKLVIGQSRLAIRIKDGALTLDLEEVALYGGKASGKVTLDTARLVPRVTERFRLSGLQAQPFLRDLAGVDFLSGTASADMRITTRGLSQHDLVAALGGKGSLKFLNGAIRGVNLGAMVRNVKSAFLDAKAGKPQQTDFAELSGTFTIKSGVAHNGDLLLKNPLLRVTGRGSTDILKRTVNYRVEPKVVTSASGQGGAAASAGLTVPVIVTGPWDKLSYRPDLEGLLKQAVKDPGAVMRTLKSITGKGKTGSSSSSSPVDTIRGLLKGLGR